MSHRNDSRLSAVGKPRAVLPHTDLDNKDVNAELREEDELDNNARVEQSVEDGVVMVKMTKETYDLHSRGEFFSVSLSDSQTHPFHFQL